MRHDKLIPLAVIPLIMILYASIAEAGLIAWFPLHGDTTTVNAIVGNLGALSSPDVPAPAPDQNGNANGALSFAADPGNDPTVYSGMNTGSYVSVPAGAGLAGLQEFTIAMWVNWSGMQGIGWTGGGNTNYGSVIARQSNGQYSNNVLGISDPDPNVGVLTWHTYGAGAWDAMGVTPVGDNVWHFVAVAVDGSTGEIDVYLDGNLEVTNTYTTAAGPPYTLNPDTTVPLTIGAWTGDGATYSNSTIHDVYLFDSYLMQTDIQNLQATGVPYRTP
jgi:hypothetical protein